MSDKTRDILKTIGAIIIIGGIVVATFLYGNKQRQDQLHRDQQIKQQQAQSNSQNQSNASVSPASQSTNGTAPAQNSVAQQNGGTNPAGQSNPESASTPSQSQPTTTPQTGDSALWLLPAFAMLWLTRMWRQSQRALAQALRS